MGDSTRRLGLLLASALLSAACTSTVEEPGTVDEPRESRLCEPVGDGCPSDCAAFHGFEIDHEAMCVGPREVVLCVRGGTVATGLYTCMEDPAGRQYVLGYYLPFVLPYEDGYGDCRIPDWYDYSDGSPCE